MAENDALLGSTSSGLPREFPASEHVTLPRLPLTPQELAYLRALQDLLDAGSYPTQKVLADKLGKTQNAVQKWLARHPEVEAHVAEAMAQEVKTKWGHILRAAYRLACRGSIDHMRFLAQVGGHLTPSGPHGVAASAGVTVVLGTALRPPNGGG